MVHIKCRYTLFYDVFEYRLNIDVRLGEHVICHKCCIIPDDMQRVMTLFASVCKNADELIQRQLDAVGKVDGWETRTYLSDEAIRDENGDLLSLDFDTMPGGRDAFPAIRRTMGAIERHALRGIWYAMLVNAPPPPPKVSRVEEYMEMVRSAQSQAGE